MDLQDKKIQSETKIKNLSDNIEKRTADAKAFIERLVVVGYDSGWETWLSTRLIGIETAKKILADEYKNKENIEKAIVVEAEQKEKARIKAEEAAAKKLKEEKEAEAAAKEAEKAAAKAAKEEVDRLKAEEEARIAIQVAKEAERAAEIAKLNATLNETVPDTRQNRHDKILILMQLFKLSGISKKEMHEKRRKIIDPNIPL